MYRDARFKSRADWNGPNLTKCAQTQLVCSEHFEETCFTLTTRMHWQQGLPYKAALNDDAVPLFGTQNMEYRKKSSNSTRGAFRKRELGRIIGEYEETSAGNAHNLTPAQPEISQPSSNQAEGALTAEKKTELPDLSENGLCVNSSEESTSMQTERDNLPVKMSSGKETLCPSQSAHVVVQGLAKDVNMCPCKQPETSSMGVQVKQCTTAKGIQVSRKVQITNAVKATQTLRRHAVKMVPSCSQYSESDCVESHPVHTDNTPNDVHSSAPSKCNKNMSFLSPLNASFQSASTVYTDDHNDPDYLPDESHSDTDEECREQVDPVKQRKFQVFEENLLELFHSCQVCEHKTEACVSQLQGTYVAVQQTCECGYTRCLDSQPRIDGIPAGNILLSAGILFSGSSPTKFLRVFSFINIMCVSVNTFFDHQRRILWPAIESTWNNYTANLMRKIKDSGGKVVVAGDGRADSGGEVVVAGDGRADSPGHCAKNGVYSFIDMNSGKVIGLQLGQSNEVKSRYYMELEGLGRAVKAVNDAGICIIEIITDRHMQIQKWIRENMPSTVDSFESSLLLSQSAHNSVHAKMCSENKMGVITEEVISAQIHVAVQT